MRISTALLLILVLIFGSCIGESPKTSFTKEKNKRISNILRKFTQAMQKKGYRAAGIGKGIDHSTGKQNYLGVVLDIEKLPDVDFARRVEVETIQEFLNCINAEEGIEEYIAEFPFSKKFIYVAFINKSREEGLFSVANSKDELYYTQGPPDMPLGPSIEIHRETFDEALAILAKQDCKSNDE